MAKKSPAENKCFCRDAKKRGTTQFYSPKATSMRAALINAIRWHDNGCYHFFLLIRKIMLHRDIHRALAPSSCTNYDSLQGSYMAVCLLQSKSIKLT